MVSRSIFGVWTRLRTLHSSTGPRARNAPKTSRFSDLQGRFCRYFRPQSPLRYLVHVWSPDTINLIEVNF